MPGSPSSSPPPSCRCTWRERSPRHARGFAPGGALAAGLDDGTVRFFDLDTGREKGPALAGHSGAVGALAFSADGSLLVTGSEDGTALVWELGA